MIIPQNVNELLYKKAFDEERKEFSVVEIIEFLQEIKQNNYQLMSETSREVLAYIKEQKEYPLKYREIGRNAGKSIIHPQQVKSALEGMEKRGQIEIKDKTIYYKDQKTSQPKEKSNA
jgi:hypothetical protein